MVHPAITRLSALLGEPSVPGDTVDWEDLARTTGLRLPADYRDFVTLYGGGELDEYLGVSTPPVAGSPYGDLIDGLDFDPREEPVARTGIAPENLEGGRLLPFAGSANSDVAFWLCDTRDPDRWDVVVFKRQHHHGEEPWVRFAAGFGDFLAGTLDGTLPNPFSDSGFARPPHAYRNWRQPL
ncbi:SMI1 / KNR4 family (SUKH-1) [Streptomyces sp. TLI_053]|uniref:SMI1/KNR4 family protein n=1 Tax=Streptomyces sp. TLI_053 TaxID=1855352 RepID=UPI0008796026|nr:SMI1/KNR4 family protein [Streptomyces sp. TLI_053]SDT83456.1 SMI1 / KNR4 family (SUKH-1) [Streptomyces sp. TLI_053]